MSGALRTVTLLGGSGNLGGLILSALIAAGFEVSVIARVSSTATFPSGVTVHRSDYSAESLLPLFRGQDAVVSSIPRADVAQQRIVIDVAVAAGVKRFLPSEFGGDTALPGIEEKIQYALGKKELGEYLMSGDLKGLTWTRVFTGPFFDWMLAQDASALGLDSGIMGWDIENLRATLYDSGEQEFNCTNIATVANAIVAVLARHEATRNQNVYVSSFRLTQNQILESLERLSGKKFQVFRASTKDLVAKGEEHLAQGQWLKAYIEVVSASCYAPWGFNQFGERAEKWNAILELPKESLDDTLRAVLREKKAI